MMDNLLPCPFCGCPAKEVMLGREDYIECDNAACGNYGNSVATAEAWNKRQQLAEQTSARSTHDVLCERKTQSVIDDGYSLMGYVLKRNDDWCVINNSAVRWLANKDMWNLMHPDSADNKSVEVLLEAANELLSQLSFDDEEGLFEHSEHVIKLRNAIDALNAYSSKPQKHLDN
jgi:hypothetical protein